MGGRGHDSPAPRGDPARIYVGEHLCQEDSAAGSGAGGEANRAALMTARYILVSHRGPYRLRLTPQGVRRERSIGGLATSLLPLMEQLGGVWITSGESTGTYTMPPRRPKFTLRY